MEIDIRQALQRLAEARLARAIAGALDAGAAAAYDVLARYPPPARGRRNPPRSARQRRYLHWLARQGRIPYRRTGNLRQKLAVIKRGERDREVRNTASYYPYVWGSRTQAQARIHAGVWPRREEAVARAERETAQTLAQLLRREGVIR